MLTEIVVVSLKLHSPFRQESRYFRLVFMYGRSLEALSLSRPFLLDFYLLHDENLLPRANVKFVAGIIVHNLGKLRKL